MKQHGCLLCSILLLIALAAATLAFVCLHCKGGFNLKLFFVVFVQIKKISPLILSYALHVPTYAADMDASLRGCTWLLNFVSTDALVG